ncbi:unnamed protein product, partial [Discosporangium mesarthrocarpum]
MNSGKSPMSAAEGHEVQGNTNKKGGHDFAKFLAYCAAAQCAETHVCSRRVSRVGYLPCPQCGGAGGGSGWAVDFARALCVFFSCPREMEQEVLEMVRSTVVMTGACSSREDVAGNSEDSSQEASSNKGEQG